MSNVVTLIPKRDLAERLLEKIDFIKLVEAADITKKEVEKAVEKMLASSHLGEEAVFAAHRAAEDAHTELREAIELMNSGDLLRWQWWKEKEKIGADPGHLGAWGAPACSYWVWYEGEGKRKKRKISAQHPGIENAFRVWLVPNEEFRRCLNAVKRWSPKDRSPLAMVREAMGSWSAGVKELTMRLDRVETGEAHFKLVPDEPPGQWSRSLYAGKHGLSGWTRRTDNAVYIAERLVECGVL